MSVSSNDPTMSGAPEPFYQTWIKALTKPSSQTYAEFAMSPNAKATTAYLWYFIAMVVQLFLASLIGHPALRQMLERFGNGQYGQYASGGSIVSRASL